MSIGLTLPFSRATGSLGFLESTRDEVSAVHQNLKSLLVTNWGDRVMHSNMGCNMIEFLFEQQHGEELKEKISDRIISQVSRWMPFVTIKNLVVVFSEETDGLPEHAIGVMIDFTLKNRPDLSSRFEFVSVP